MPTRSAWTKGRTKSRRSAPGYLSGAARRKKNKARDAAALAVKNAREIRLLKASTMQKTSYQVLGGELQLLPPHATVRVSSVTNLASYSAWAPLFGSNAQVSSFQPRACVKQYRAEMKLSIQDTTKALPKCEVQVIFFRLKKETGTQLMVDTTNMTNLDGKTNGQYYQASLNDGGNMGPVTLNPKYFNIIADKRVTMCNTTDKVVSTTAQNDSPNLFDVKNQFETIYFDHKCNDKVYNPSGSADQQAAQHWKNITSDKVELHDRLYMITFCSGYNSTVIIAGSQEPNGVKMHCKVLAQVETTM